MINYSKNKPIVSVCMITYNHEKYIQQAIDGVLMQETNFPLELVIGEDCSMDNTLAICEEYAEKNPEIILLLPSKTNLGMMPNSVRTLTACAGKYIALCEGDDYWTDPLKLQKQVNFLETHPEFSLCFHNAIIRYEDNRIKDGFFCNSNTPEISATVDIIRSFYIPTASMVFRKSALHLPSWFYHTYNGDYALSLLLSLSGKIKYFDECMSVYFKNAGGLNARIKNSNAFYKIFELLSYFDMYSGFNYHEEIISRKNELKNIIELAYNLERPKIEKFFSYIYWKYKITKSLR